MSDKRLPMPTNLKMDEEGNYISPDNIGEAKKLLRSITLPRSSPTKTSVSNVSPTTAVTARSSSTTACLALAVPQPTAAAAATTTTTRCVATVSTAVATPARQVVRVPASELFRFGGPIPAHGLPPCVTGGVRLARSQQDDDDLVSTMETALEEKNKATTMLIKKHRASMMDMDTTIARLRSEIMDKDTTIARLKSEIKDKSQSCEGQLSQLLWLNSVVSEMEVQLFDKDLAISALEDTVSDQATTITQMQAKFISIYTHCQNLASELARKDEMLCLLKESDVLQQTLCKQQKDLTRSTLALVRQHKTRFIMGDHSVVSRPNDSSPEVQQERDLAAARIGQVKREQERADHKKLSDAVDVLAKKYDRYNLITTVNIHNTRCDPDGLPCIVPRDMMGLWLFADMEEVPTDDEVAMYEFHLQQQVRPPPIYSPNLPRPTVNWTTLNKHKRKNLPDPELFPIQSVPADPTFYEDVLKYKAAEQHSSHQYCGVGNISIRMTKGECGCAVCVPPFGHMYGLMTDMGVISMPDTSVHGYRWNDDSASWVIATGG